jgi:hypothetical protein
VGCEVRGQYRPFGIQHEDGVIVHGVDPPAKPVGQCCLMGLHRNPCVYLGALAWVDAQWQRLENVKPGRNPLQAMTVCVVDDARDAADSLALLLEALGYHAFAWL